MFQIPLNIFYQTPNPQPFSHRKDYLEKRLFELCELSSVEI